MKTLKRGAVFAIEGLDGAGKTSAIEVAITKLTEKGYDAVAVSSSVGTAFASALFDIFKSGLGEGVDHTTRALLVSAAKRSVYQDVIAPALAKNQIVLLDRFSLTTRVYQHRCPHLEELIELSTPDSQTDRIVILDVIPEVAEARLSTRRGVKIDHLESVVKEEREKRRAIMLDWYYKHPTTTAVVCANAPLDVVADRLVNEVECFAYDKLV